jgi:hypothetical protein
MSSHLGSNPQNNLGNAHPNFRGPSRRNLQGQSRRSFQLPMFRQVEVGLEKLTVKEVTEAVTGTLQAIEAKDIQEATGGSIRAAENARQGLNAMSLTNFVNACRAIPELRAVAMQLIGAEGNTDPEFHRALHHLVNSYVRRG